MTGVSGLSETYRFDCVYGWTMTERVRRDINELTDSVPTWAYIVLSFLLGVSGLYSFSLGRLDVWVSFWLGAVQLGLFLFVIYLLYRLVLAVERIAD
jgi:hypothetical protein